MIRCAVFDFDGTLVDSNSIKHATFYDIVEGIQQGKVIIAELLQRAHKLTRYTLFEQFAKKAAAYNNITAIEDWSLELVERYTKLCEQRVVECEEWPGASYALQWLKDNKQYIYINSATPEKDLIPVVEKRGLAAVIDGVFGGPRSKLENLQTIMREKNLKPEEIIMIGDGVDDWRGAEALPCAFIPIGNGTLLQSDFQEQPHADLTVVPDIITRLNQTVLQS